MAQIEITNDGLAAGETIGRVPTAVRVKRNWSDAWGVIPYLHAVQGYRSAAPAVPEMVLRFEYGNIKREDAAAWAQEWPQILDNYYCQVVALYPGAETGEGESVLWTGVIAQPEYRPDASDTASGAAPLGTQTLYAHGLEHVLDRVRIVGAYAHRAADTTDVLIDWSPQFNERHRRGGRVLGNKSQSGVTFGGGDDVEVWTLKDILDYVASFFPSSPQFEYEIPSGIETLLENIEPIVRLEGLTVREALNKLIGRNRGLGWCVDVDSTDGATAQIRLFSQAMEDIGIGDNVLPANEDQHDLSFETGLDIGGVVIRFEEQARFDQIVVRGERVKSCFTVSYADDSLEAGWSAAEEAAYLSPGKSGANANDVARQQARFDRVFQLFRIPAAWDWLAGDGIGGSTNIANPNATPYGTVSESTAGTYVNHSKGLLPWLPFEVGKDYSSSIYSPTDRNPSDAEPEQLRAFVLWKDSGDKYHFLNRPPPGGGQAPAHVRWLDRELGFVIDLEPNHVLGLNHWTGADASNLIPSSGNAIDWEDMIATVFVETDSVVQAVVDVVEDTTSEVPRKLVIDVPGVEMWYVTAQTVCDVDGDGALVSVANNGLIRDDSNTLRAIAVAAKGWYGKRRAAVRLQYAGIRDFLQIGAMISSVSSPQMEQVGTVIDRVGWNFGSKDAAGVTTVQTGMADVDFRAVL